ncbi:hypothetical protein N7447_010586 [Penicillium robsamsonii]|uniref:uncharacterized protein n=1 Tax=Penicillium robsamsonii TaxID=1792511 RepID=UPI00254886BA|nr:uncharacterized protein N7447_010586 [Penicillium robsamsonii]KAJ5811070.1 hypothetical protein N7447_010586 [Penicillium robsamsonii]
MAQTQPIGRANVTFKAHRAIICTQSHSCNSAPGPGFQKNTLSRSHTQEAPAKSQNKAMSLEHKQAVASKTFPVYLVADKFGILPLEKLTAFKISVKIEDNWMTSLFPEIALKIFLSIPLGIPLFCVLVEVICDNVDSRSEKREILKLLQDYGQLGSLVIARIVENDVVGSRQALDSQSA